MTQMRGKGYFFVDSRTTKQTVAAQVAKGKGVPVMSRDVFLDNEVNEAHIEEQFEGLIALARTKGYAVAIGHPHPATISVLRKVLPKLRALGGKVVPVSSQLKAAGLVGLIKSTEAG